MSRKLLFVLPLLLSVQLFAQLASMNIDLLRYIQANGMSNEMIPLLVKGDPLQIEDFVKSNGGDFKYAVHDIASVNLPCHIISELAQHSFVIRIEGKQGEGMPLDDQSLINSDVNPVHAGAAPLAQAYTGQGVLVGMIDSGIDFYHPDFMNPDGSTKVLNLWDQNSTTGGTTPLPYNYGQEWDSSSINSGSCPYYEPAAYFGHGSNVAGMSVSSGLAVNNFRGVAYESNLLVVDVSFNANFLNNVVDATHYIYDKANALGMPCVINASVGTYNGSHDGKDLAAELIDALVAQQNGQAFICAAGNAGGQKFHLGYDVTSDSTFTWFKYEPSLLSAQFEIFGDTGSFQNIQFAFGADQHIGTYSFRGKTPWRQMSNFNLSTVDSLKDTLWVGPNRIGRITMYTSQYNGVFDMAVIIKPDTTSYYWRFIAKGTGRFDCWSSLAYTGTSGMVDIPTLPTSATFPDMIHYKTQDADQTIVSSFSCSENTISVANYTNRTQYINVFGTISTINGETTGNYASTSSWGPSRDGKVKPNISAPGSGSLCTSRLATAVQYQYSNPNALALGGMHNSNGGTSMAAPQVAGIVALYLQLHPNAGWLEIKDALETSARQDNFTTNNLPDKIWGYGKADAYQMFISNVVYGCTDPFSINFNPNATMDDGSCQPIVFGCTDLLALNYNAGANMNDGSCQFATGISGTSTPSTYLSISPNPSHDQTLITFNISTGASSTKIRICDINGKMIDEDMVNTTSGVISYNRILAPGLYICRLMNEEKVFAEKKLIRY